MNIEAKVISYLSKKTNYEVFADVPEVRPETFITVELTGGNSERFKTNPSLAIQCWADTRFHASEIALQVQSVLWEFVDEDGIMKVEQNHPYNFPDENTSARYQFVLDVITA